MAPLNKGCNYIFNTVLSEKTQRASNMKERQRPTFACHLSDSGSKFLRGNCSSGTVADVFAVGQ